MNEQVLRMTNCTQLFSSLKLRMLAAQTAHLAGVSSRDSTRGRNGTRGRWRCGEHSSRGPDQSCSQEQRHQEAALRRLRILDHGHAEPEPEEATELAQAKETTNTELVKGKPRCIPPIIFSLSFNHYFCVKIGFALSW
jgi:hypothetical protein